MNGVVKKNMGPFLRQDIKCPLLKIDKEIKDISCPKLGQYYADRFVKQNSVWL